MNPDYTVRNGDIMLLKAQAPYILIQKKSGETLIPPVLFSAAPAQIGLSPNGRHFVVSYNSSPFLEVYDTLTWTLRSGLVDFPNYGALIIRFNNDESKFAVGLKNWDGSEHRLYVYNTANLSRIPLPLNADKVKNQVYDVSFSPNGLMIAGASSDNDDEVFVHNLADMSKLDLSARFSTTSDCRSVEFSTDSAKLYYSLHSTSGATFRVLNAVTWSEIDNPNLHDYIFNLRVSPDGAKIAISPNSSDITYIHDTSTWALLSTLSFNILNNWTSSNNETQWLDNNTILVRTSAVPGFVTFNATTGETLDETVNAIYQINTALSMPLDANVYEINGTIDESLVADSWIVQAYLHDTGKLIGQKEFTGSTFTVDLNSNPLCTVTVTAKQGDVWLKDSVIAINTKSIPTDPASTPYYYIATTGGTTGATEPVWPVDPAGTVVDGNVTWQRVERLIQPVTQGPLVPTVKP